MNITRSGFLPAISSAPKVAMPRFGSSSILPGQKGHWDESQVTAAQILEFVEPKPNALLQKPLLEINQHLLLHGITIDIPEAERKKLRNIVDEGAGNILVGSHPDPSDGHILVAMYRYAETTPAGMLMAADAMMGKYRRFLPILRRVGAIPVVRGRKNDQVVAYTVKQLSDGKWTGAYPEGTVYFSRQTIPNSWEYGSVRMALEAATQNIKAGNPRDIYITPFAHAYFYKNEKKALGNMLERLGQMESLPELFGKPQQGTLAERMINAAEKLMENKAKEFGIFEEPTAEWRSLDIYGRGEFLKKAVLDSLEVRYFGKTSDIFDRRKVIKIKASIHELLSEVDEAKKAGQVTIKISALSDKPLSLSDAEHELREDLKKVQIGYVLIAFMRDYLDKFDDLETRAEFMRRFFDATGQNFEKPFGDRRVVIKVLDPVNMTEKAKEFMKLKDDAAKKDFMFALTEEIRLMVQGGIDAIVSEESLRNRTWTKELGNRMVRIGRWSLRRLTEPFRELRRYVKHRKLEHTQKT